MKRPTTREVRRRHLLLTCRGRSCLHFPQRGWLATSLFSAIVATPATLSATLSATLAARLDDV